MTRTLTALVGVWDVSATAAGGDGVSVLPSDSPAGSGLSWQLKEGCLLAYELLIDMLLSSQREHVHPYARMGTAVRPSGGGGGGGGEDDNSSVASAERGQSPHAAGAPAPRAPGMLGPVSPSTRRPGVQDGSGAVGVAPSLQTPVRVTYLGAGGGGGATPASQPSPWLSPECITAATRRAGGGVGGATASAAAAGGARGGGSDLDGVVEGDPVSGDDSGDEGATGTAAPAGVDASPSDHVEALVSGGSDDGGMHNRMGGGGARVFWGDTAASLVERLRCTDGAGRGVSDALWAMLLQTTACMGAPQFELKRMSDQVLPLLTELLMWCAATRARARFGVVGHRVSLI